MFRRICLNNINRLCILKLLKKIDEKEIIINDVHSINNHSDRDLKHFSKW